jgi:hypothetical protein
MVAEPKAVITPQGVRDKGFKLSDQIADFYLLWEGMSGEG